ncbi:hypothetical protein [Boseongicola aestuarii]|uniref:Porin domain-containing protein n=1 Tax=Boseongicola aestuarii TaxID=1470561 RepID=A0A238IV17_9RHOB|nr:hypothetical protein [Boseongicola aestuarii]SMX22289.1 hypothetical protein BOA8489_00380 [Boseongicola aestuarii]
MRYPLAAFILICVAGSGHAEEQSLVIDDASISLDFASVSRLATDAPETSFRFGGAAVEPRVKLGLSANDDRRATYASAGFDASFGEVGIGRPRSILDNGPLPDGAPGVPQTLRPLAAEAALDERLGAGLRVSAKSGPVSFGTSLHSIEQSNISVLGFAGRYDVDRVPVIDKIAVYGGAESDGDEQRFRLGTEMTRGITTAGVDVLRSNEDQGRTLSQVYLGLALTSSVSLGVSGLRDTLDASDTTDTRFGLGASIATVGGAFIRGGVDGFTSDDPAFGLSVGFEF